MQDQDNGIPTDEATAIAQWLSDGRKARECPRWYRTLRAARYLGLPPWVLDEYPEWAERAWIAVVAEERFAAYAATRPRTLKVQGRLGL